MLAETSTKLTDNLQQATQILAQSSQICILTGAGISAESGIPTFRDKQTGLWEQYRAEDLASTEAFERDPKLVWSWYQWRRQLVHDKVPNAAHLALARWQQAQSHKITLITQNVDDLHEQANHHEQTSRHEPLNDGKPLDNLKNINSTVHHLHGHLWRNRCSQCRKPYTKRSVQLKSDINFDPELIRCSACDALIRPDIVWFGESLPVDSWQIAEQAAANCEVFISIGTSSLVYPAAGLAQLAKQKGAKIIEINPNPTANSFVDITLAAKAGEIMPLLVAGIAHTYQK